MNTYLEAHPNLADIMDDIKQIEEEFKRNNCIHVVKGERLCRDLKYCKTIVKIVMKGLEKEGYKFKRKHPQMCGKKFWEFSWRMYHEK